MIRPRLFAGASSLALFSFVVIACSGDDATAAITADQACNDAASALCDKLEACSPLLLNISIGTRDQCMARFKINCPQSFTATGTSSTPGRLAQCSKDARAVECEKLLAREPPETCRTLAGTLEDGTVCGSSDQCKNRLCRIAKGSTCGACSSLGAAGAACDRDDECDYALACRGQKCVAYAKAGNACGANQPCLPSLGCTNGTCAATLAAGAPCTFKADENPCDLLKGFYCHPKTKICSTVETAAPGGACELSAEKIVVCTASSECKRAGLDPTGNCQAAASDGATCNDDTGPKCISPARCNGGICTITDPSKCK